ncbi:DUF3040 domain-containing protein [Streptomyces sp. NPDC054784]
MRDFENDRVGDDDRLGDLEERLRLDDPRFATALAAGEPTSPREYRHTSAWSTLAVAGVVLGTGVLLSHGLLLATGLVLAGAAGHLFDPQRHDVRRRARSRA